MKKPLRLSARGASFHTEHASNANVDRVVLLDVNLYLALWTKSKENERVNDESIWVMIDVNDAIKVKIKDVKK
jgi:hypothetical protein